MQETWALQVEFSLSILPIAWRHTTIFAWFTPSLMHSHMVTSYRFLGGLSLYMVWWCLVHFLNTTGPSLTKVDYADFDRISYIYIFKSNSEFRLCALLKFDFRIPLFSFLCLSFVFPRKSKLIWIQFCISFILLYFLLFHLRTKFVLSSSFVSFSRSFLPFSFLFFNCPFFSTFLFLFLSQSSRCSNLLITLAIT